MKLIMHTLRWVAVIPASLGASWIAYALLRLGDTIWGASGFQDFTLDTLAHCTYGFIFVYAGAYVAPKLKNIAAIVLSTIFILTIISITLINLNSYDVSWRDLTLWGQLVMVVASIVGSVFAIAAVSDEFPEY
jgi:hypothetical protein